MPEGVEIQRPFWDARLAEAWRVAPIVWLSGVRRSGKTTIARALPGARFLNCDLPSVQRELEDPEAFYAGVHSAQVASAASAASRGAPRSAARSAARAASSTVVFDEIHRLRDPSAVLKIGADAFPSLRILATGSSTLAATRKFRDSLAGRKREVNLQPVLFEELPGFGADIEKRLLHGGMPQMLLAARPDPGFYSEWLDSYFARDVAELFRVERRSEFLLLLRLLMRQNGGLATVVNLAKQCGATRPTVLSWIEAMRITHVIHLLRPFHGNGDAELVKQPKIYGFDTGFVAHENGWSELRSEERGLLWENVVLEHLLSRPSQPEIHYWRDKQQREVDFVIPRGRSTVDAIECKWDLRRIDARGMKAFRALYPKGSNYVLSPGVAEPYTRVIDGIELTIASPQAIQA
jgi:predicted AAA+ superfamily ATPase